MIQNNGLDFWDTNLNYKGGHGSQKRRFVLYRDKFWLLQSTEIPCGTVAVNTAGAVVPCFSAQGGSLTFLWCPDFPGMMLGWGLIIAVLHSWVWLVRQALSFLGFCGFGTSDP